MTDDLLTRTTELAGAFLDSLDSRPVGPQVDLAALRAALGGPMPIAGEPPRQVIEALARDVDPGLVASAAHATSGSSSVVAPGGSRC